MNQVFVLTTEWGYGYADLLSMIPFERDFIMDLIRMKKEQSRSQG